MRQRLHLFSLILLCVPAPVFAQATGQTCAKIEDEPKRLICYDLLFRSAEDETEAPSRKPVDEAVALAWPMSSSPLPTGKGLAISISALSPEPVTDSDQSATLTITCAAKNTSLSFWFPGYFMGSDDKGRTITAKIGGNSAQSIKTSSVDRMMNIAPAIQAIPLLQSMIAADAITVTATPTSGGPISARFDLKYLAQAIEPIREDCNW